MCWQMGTDHLGVPAAEDADDSSTFCSMAAISEVDISVMDDEVIEDNEDEEGMIWT